MEQGNFLWISPLELHGSNIELRIVVIRSVSVYSVYNTYWFGRVGLQPSIGAAFLFALL